MQLSKKYFSLTQKLEVKGFTLLEVLLVVGAVSVLATITVIAINPGRQMMQMRDNERKREIEQIYSALRQYYYDNKKYPYAIENLPYTTLMEICAQNATDCTEKLDLDQDLTPSYLNTLPSDNSVVSPNTGYFVYKVYDGRLLVYTNRGELVEEMVFNGTLEDMACPIGYVLVPGNLALYSTSDFCVMKYEAKVDANADGIGDTSQTTVQNTWPNNTHPVGIDGRTLVSSAAGYPLAYISQTSAAAACTGVGAGARLISNAEWMTIARNMEGVASNWTGGSVGSGGLWRGHSDNAPATALEASTDDGAGYTGTGQSSGEQRRTHTSSNGQVIWDMSGNLWDWTNDTIKANEKPSGSEGMGVSVYGYQELTSITLYGALSYDLVRPSNVTWDSAQNMGKYIKAEGDNTTLYGFMRGGSWIYGHGAGLFNLELDGLPLSGFPDLGFRCSMPKDTYKILL